MNIIKIWLLKFLIYMIAFLLTFKVKLYESSQSIKFTNYREFLSKMTNKYRSDQKYIPVRIQLKTPFNFDKRFLAPYKSVNLDF